MALGRAKMRRRMATPFCPPCHTSYPSPPCAYGTAIRTWLGLVWGLMFRVWDLGLMFRVWDLVSRFLFFYEG